MDYVRLLPGDPAPWFKQRCGENPRFTFDSIAGRYVVLFFFGTGGNAAVKRHFSTLARHRAMFDDDRCCFFGVSVDPADEASGLLNANLPGIRFFSDFDGSVSRLYGALPKDATSGQTTLQPFWMVLDPMLRVMAKFDLEEGEAAMRFVQGLPDPNTHVGYEVGPPILILPRVFEPEFCQRLIAAYEVAGGEESGFMREVDGKTVLTQDAGFKRRKDFHVEDDATMRELQARIIRRVAPELRKCYSFTATRMERYLVGCYAEEDSGHFRPHRDNTTKGTAHRRFAVSINLNDDFEGGELSFPEFGRRGYKAPVGAALIFPGAILHAVSQVTRGRRYAFLPFVYDEEAAKIREQNAAFVDGPAYKASQPA